MARKKVNKPTLLEGLKQTRSRDWGFKPTTRIVQDKRKKANREACRRYKDME